MNFGKLIMALLLATAACAAPAQDAQDVVATGLKVVAFPKIDWPGAVDREALVYLELCIGTDGKATDIRVGDGGFHEKRFVDSAVRATQAAQFAPATVNGQPVVRCARMPVRFAVVDQQKGVTQEFKDELRKVEALINKQDYSGANFHAQWMLSERVRLLYEYAMLNATLAQTYARVGENYAALAAVRQATGTAGSRITSFSPGAPIQKDSFSNYMLPEPILLPLLRLRIALAASLGFYLDALEAYSVLAGLSDLAPNDPYVQSADKLTQLVLSDKPLVAKARLMSDGYWTHSLSRRTFTVQSVQGGTMQSVELFCETGSTLVLDFKPAEKWKLPDDWNKCSVTFKGQPGTEFLIVESVPAKPNQGASQ